jgi:uncharacterized protein
MSLFVVASVAAIAVVVMLAALFRSRAYALFRLVTLSIHTLLASALWPLFSWSSAAFVALHATVFVNALALVAPRMRPLWYRAIVSLPAAWFSAATLFALPWAVASGLGFSPWAAWLPYAVALVGVAQSLSARREQIDLVVADGDAGPRLRRYPRGEHRSERPLRIVQLSDPHLGPFMSVARLREIAERAVARDPDLVVLTGDFLTMESQQDPAILSSALEPLRALDGRVFACFGNHDHEAPETVKQALAELGAILLVDDSAVLETPTGRVQVVGIDYRWRGRRKHLREVCARHPRVPGALRLLLLHDPGAFRRLPPGEADLVLSGHTHGGQVGFVSLGLPWTLLRVLMNAPDHGFWARGGERLYVHRGTGHYGFPLRLGVPAEESLLCVHGALESRPRC